MSLSRRTSPAHAVRGVTALLMLAAWAAVAEEGMPSFEEIWFDEPVISESQQVRLAVTAPEAAPPHASIVFDLDVFSLIPFEQAGLQFDVRDDMDVVLHHAVYTVDLSRGRNELSVNWDAAALAPGAYTLNFFLKYTASQAPARCALRARRVSAAHWATALDALDTRLATLSDHMGRQEEERPEVLLRRLRLRIAMDAKSAARRALAARQWRLADRHVAYVQFATDALRADMTFPRALPEPNPTAGTSLERVTLSEGLFLSNDIPIFLFGGVLNPAGEFPLDAQVERLASYGFNLAVLPLPLGMRAATALGAWQEAATAAARHRMALTAQVDQRDIAGPLMDQYPDAAQGPFVNMAHEGLAAAYRQRLLDLAAAMRDAPVPVALCIGVAPQFKFAGEAIRQQFVSWVRERHPDRIDLNRLWRAHLADYDEITIWSDEPTRAYHHRRAYQYEWQDFHHDLITRYFAEIEQALAAVAPGVPLMLSLPDAAFSPGETRHSPNRAAISAMMDINACSAAAGLGESPLYAMGYPHPHASYTLMRSHAPRKPILNMDAVLHLDPKDTAARRYSLARCAVWESVMMGANALAFPLQETLAEYPEAMEGVAVAAAEINRLATVIASFHQARPEIGILFSEAAKIMDDGVPHLMSALHAFEGASFAGYHILFVTDAQIAAGILDTVRVLILPETMAVSDETFERISGFVERGGMVARVGTPIPYNERGHSRADVIRATGNTVLVRGMNLPTEYLHAIDAALAAGALPDIPRPINAFGYPLEGVRARFVEHEGNPYFYVVNLRNEPVDCHLSGAMTTGYDLIQGRELSFPRLLPPLEPLLLRMDRQELNLAASAP